MRIIIFIFLAIFSLTAFSQEIFNIEDLNHPNRYGEKVKKAFTIEELPEFFVDTSLANTLYLENGLREHDFKNISNWFDAKKEIDTVKQINIVFSKYPVRDGVYSMLIPLLFNRLKELLSLDPELNDKNIDWKITLQTNCPSDAATAKLFHGIAIKYVPYNSNEIEIEDSESIPLKKFKRTTTGYINEFYKLPEDLIKTIDTSSSKVKQEKLFIDYLEKKIANNSKDSSFDYTHKDSIKKIKRRLTYYERFHSSKKDSTVLKVLERNRWKDALVVCDWTGSMYSYGGQLMLWHLANIDSSGLKYLTLFNDGDNKRQMEKVIGRTGGIYHTRVNNIDNVFDLYNLVMFKGCGGDGPENDIEAILAAIDKFKEEQIKEVVLIADNSCVRDMILLDKVELPVHVIMCGFEPYNRLNPQYLDIARKTNGSLHTIEFDMDPEYYDNLQPNTAVAYLRDSLKLKDYYYCDRLYTIPTYYKFKSHIDTTHFANIDTAHEASSLNKILNISNKNYEKLPRKLFKIKSMIALNASSNNIKKIPANINDANRLAVLNFEENQIEKIPDELSLLRNMRNLNLSNNKIESLPETFSYMRLLEYCDLSNNNLSSLPKRFYFSKMRILTLSNNKIASLPYFGGMKKLITLDLSNNSLTDLPNSISRLSSLENLDLSNNRIKTMPKHIYRLKKLQKLILIGNPISDEEIIRLQEIFPNLQIEI